MAPRLQRDDRKVALTTVNSHVTCALCTGYMIDASTICACLHTFCRSCIIRFAKRHKRCPICDIRVKRHSKSRPSIRPDIILQELIYKLVPGLIETEIKRRNDFYNKRNQSDKKKLTREIEKEDDISICLELRIIDDNGNVIRGADDQPINKRYLLCPSAFSIRLMKKFIRNKFNLSEKYQITIFSEDSQQFTSMQSMRDVAFECKWMREAPLHLYYSVFIPSRIVIPEPQPEVNLSTGSTGANTTSSCTSSSEYDMSPSVCLLTPKSEPIDYGYGNYDEMEEDEQAAGYEMDEEDEEAEWEAAMAKRSRKDVRKRRVTATSRVVLGDISVAGVNGRQVAIVTADITTVGVATRMGV